MGLLHDIGKALTHEQEGSHPELSLQVLTKYNESPQVINAALCGHENVEAETIEAVLVEAADGISAARPGRPPRRARVATSSAWPSWRRSRCRYKGVEMCYAIQAGRELRVMTKADDRQRPRRPPARQGHLQAHRGRDAVPRPHQGGRHPRDARRRSGEVGRTAHERADGRRRVRRAGPRRRPSCSCRGCARSTRSTSRVVNVENAAGGFGVTPPIARASSWSRAPT